MVEIYQGLNFAEKLVFAKTGKSLSDIQIAVLRKFCEEQRITYDRIAEELGYSASYIKQTVAPKLWYLLSEALGEKVNKTNFRSILQRQQTSQVLRKVQTVTEGLMQPLEPDEPGRVTPVALSDLSSESPLPVKGVQKHTREGNGENFYSSSLLTFNIQNPKLIELELPEGRVPLSSPFYIERVPHESRCYEEIVKPGAFIHIQAPRQMGKTSLMVRILAHAASMGYQTASVNLQRADQAILTNLDKFLRWFACEVSHKLKLKPKLDDYWHEDLGSKASCTKYFQDYLLAQLDTPLVLAVDEMNEIIEHPQIAQDFLSLLRSWYEEAKDCDIWQKLRLVVVNSTEVYIPLNINKSPLKVGLQIQLLLFSWEQLNDLAQRHRLNLSEGELAQLMWLVAGHPYLLRVALYHLAQKNLTMEKLVQTAASDTGIYSEHLHRQLWYLQQHPGLAAVFEKVLKARVPVELEQVQAFKLHSTGLVSIHNHQVITSCSLYQEYFSDRFLV